MNFFRLKTVLCCSLLLITSSLQAYVFELFSFVASLSTFKISFASVFGFLLLFSNKLPIPASLKLASKDEIKILNNLVEENKKRSQDAKEQSEKAFNNVSGLQKEIETGFSVMNKKLKEGNEEQSIALAETSNNLKQFKKNFSTFFGRLARNAKEDFNELNGLLQEVENDHKQINLKVTRFKKDLLAISKGQNLLKNYLVLNNKKFFSLNASIDQFLKKTEQQNKKFNEDIERCIRLADLLQEDSEFKEENHELLQQRLQVIQRGMQFLVSPENSFFKTQQQTLLSPTKPLLTLKQN